jgi:hypothetical protein
MECVWHSNHRPLGSEGQVEVQVAEYYQLTNFSVYCRQPGNCFEDWGFIIRNIFLNFWGRSMRTCGHT